jgi:hypothetical protein
VKLIQAGKIPLSVANNIISPWVIENNIISLWVIEEELCPIKKLEPSRGFRAAVFHD